MRFFRGISVHEAEASKVVADIRRDGLVAKGWNWSMLYHKPDQALLLKDDLSLIHTRPTGEDELAVCACGSIEGAHFYAWRHNRTGDKVTPIIIEFEADVSEVAIDGRDFLYTVIQMGDPERARSVVQSVFGEKALQYAEKAWSVADQGKRIAITDIMIHDPEVIEAHYGNSLVIAGRYNTEFKNAFIVRLPVLAEQIRGVEISDRFIATSGASIRLDDVR